jgi:hypothetical protein
MAVSLQNLSKPIGKRPIIATLFGEGGMGKTTLAAMFPAPMLIRVEDGTISLQGFDGIDMTPAVKSSGEVGEWLDALLTSEHAFKTVIIDSVTQLATLIEKEITEASGAKSINQANGGYGAGYKAAADVHRRLRDKAGLLIERGINVIFIAHATTEEMDLPDMDKYKRYSVRLHQHVAPHYTDNVDMVALIKLKTWLVGAEGESSKAQTSSEREIICYPQPASVTKNRFHIKETLPFDFSQGNPFAPYLPE